MQQWSAVAERDLRTGYIALTAKAEAALQQYEYEKAITLAARSLKLKPAQPAALDVLYAASMYTGDFGAASDAAEKLCGLDQGSIVYARDLAEALAAQRLGTAAVVRFEDITRSTARPPEVQHPYDAEAAGLALMAGDESHARNLARHADTLSPKPAGETLERIGRWYYLAGNYEVALRHMTSAQELYPGQPEASVLLGWAALQNNKMQTAQSSFLSASSPSAVAGLAVSAWRTEERDRAVAIAAQLTQDPRWKNERWVSFAYGPAAYHSLAEIETERLARMRAKR